MSMEQEKKWDLVELFPGTMGLCGVCCALLGPEHVLPGAWMEPVALTDVSKDEIDIIISLLAEKDMSVTAQYIR